MKWTLTAVLVSLSWLAEAKVGCSVWSLCRSYTELTYWIINKHPFPMMPAYIIRIFFTLCDD